MVDRVSFYIILLFSESRYVERRYEECRDEKRR